MRPNTTAGLPSTRSVELIFTNLIYKKPIIACKNIEDIKKEKIMETVFFLHVVFCNLVQKHTADESLKELGS